MAISFKGLLGSMAAPQNQYNSLLGIDPRAARWNAIGGFLEGAGVGLMTGDWSKGLEASNAADERFQRQQLLGYEMKKQADNQAYDRSRDAKADERWQTQFDYTKGRDAKEDNRWNLTYELQKQAANKVDTPASVREYNFAVQNGYKGSFADWQTVGKSGGMSLGVDPATGALTVMAGGGGGSTGLPAEMGGRMGLGEQFLTNDVPAIEPGIKRGDATGPIDYVQGVFGRGNAGVIHRRMATGADALRRGLTGAGMGVAEADEYANRYLPTWSDNAETLAGKLKSLETDLEAVKRGALAGKSGNLSAFLPGSKVFATDPAPTQPQQAQPQQAQPQANIPREAVSELMADPSPAAIEEFDAVFGQGAAQSVLGGR